MAMVHRYGLHRIEYIPECDEYIRILKYSNSVDQNIHSDIRLDHFLDTNIFGYSFVSTFWIQIYSDIHS